MCTFLQGPTRRTAGSACSARTRGRTARTHASASTVAPFVGTKSFTYFLPPGTRAGAIIRYYRDRLRGKWKLRPALSAYPYWAVFQHGDATLMVFEHRSSQPRVWWLSINYARLSPDATADLSKRAARTKRN